MPLITADVRRLIISAFNIDFGAKSLLQIFSPKFVTTCVIDLQVGLKRFFRRCEAQNQHPCRFCHANPFTLRRRIEGENQMQSTILTTKTASNDVLAVESIFV